MTALDDALVTSTAGNVATNSMHGCNQEGSKEERRVTETKVRYLQMS